MQELHKGGEEDEDKVEVNRAAKTAPSSSSSRLQRQEREEEDGTARETKSRRDTREERMQSEEETKEEEQEEIQRPNTEVMFLKTQRESGQVQRQFASTWSYFYFRQIKSQCLQSERLNLTPPPNNSGSISAILFPCHCRQGSNQVSAAGTRLT